MNTTYTVTLNAIRAYRPCRSSWCTLLQSLGKTKADDTSITIAYIFGLLGITDALWALRALSAEHDRDVRWLVCNLVTPALQYVNDQNVVDALETARDYVRYKATALELADAYNAAQSALYAKAAAYKKVTAANVAACAVMMAVSEEVAKVAHVAANVVAQAAVKSAEETTGADAQTVKTITNAVRIEQERILRSWLRRD